MTRVEDPAQELGEVIRSIQRTTDVLQLKIGVGRGGPVLDGEELNVNVAGSLRGSAVVDEFDGAGVVFTKSGWPGWWKAQVGQHIAKVLGNLCSGDSSNELCLGGAGGGDALGLAAVGDGSTSIKESIASGGATVAEVIGMGGINKPMEAVVRKGWV